jgi:hypothetical protein
MQNAARERGRESVYKKKTLILQQPIRSTRRRTPPFSSRPLLQTCTQDLGSKVARPVPCCHFDQCIHRNLVAWRGMAGHLRSRRT